MELPDHIPDRLGKGTSVGKKPVSAVLGWVGVMPPEAGG